MNEFDCIVVWMAKDEKERNENNSCLDIKKKRKEKICHLIYC